MRNEVLDEFNNKIIKEAIKKVDAEKMAKILSVKIETALSEGFDKVLENGFDFEYWLTDELTNEKTVAGKAFKKAMNAMAKRMAEAVYITDKVAD